MKEAILYKKLKQGKVQCQVCEKKCLIEETKWGYCQTRKNIAGKLYTSLYGMVSSLNIDPIEKKPVFHFKPCSYWLSLGTYGCNFRCLFCQNWHLSHFFPSSSPSLNIDKKEFFSPEELVNSALNSKTIGIAWTYNEPTIWLEYFLDGAKLAKKKNLFTCWVTNGYATKKTLNLIAPYLDVFRVDLKSSEKSFYQKLCQVNNISPVFENLIYLKKKYPKIHIEVVTNIVPDFNDSEQNIKNLAIFIKENLGEKTPWHLTRFFPAAQMTEILPTSKQTLLNSYQTAKKIGLKFVYLGNLLIDKEDDTFCPKCDNLIIKRDGYQAKILSLDKKGKCSICGEDLNIIV